MSTATLPRLLTAGEVANWLVLTAAAVDKMAKRRQIPCVELPDGSRLFEAEVLAEWVRARRTGGDGTAA
jgi:hypothetical protein